MKNTSPEAESLAVLLRLLDVEQIGEDHFLGSRKPGGIGRVFGGQVIGQALASAERTVAPDRAVHSLHAYFLRGGSEDHPIDFRVERDFDGGSFSNRRVIASQLGRPILNLVASFHIHEQGIQHTTAMPTVPDPEGLANTTSLLRARIDQLPEALRARVLAPSLIEIRPADPDYWYSTKVREPSWQVWFRAPARLPDDPRIHRAILAYASDLTLLGTSTLPHGVNWTSGRTKGASLDHAIWFHDHFRTDEWLLYAMDSPWAGSARGFNRGMIFAQDGRLVAEVAQEGLIRIAA